MHNEFYKVVLYYADEVFYFKNKNNAFDFLWQNFLDRCGDEMDDNHITSAKVDLYYYYVISDFGEVDVCGFED